MVGKRQARGALSNSLNFFQKKKKKKKIVVISGGNKRKSTNKSKKLPKSSAIKRIELQKMTIHNPECVQ